ncbi:MAG: hypothetical protein HW387_1355 [Parachlamydiales bacterium]|nr:hypothetical protein [Parachlamydiales bacterium]
MNLFEFDAVLMIQEASRSCCVVAIGGAGKKPNRLDHECLLQKKLILFALDFDEMGKQKYSYWRRTYSNLRPWPVPEGKSPGDYFVAGSDLNGWIQAGIEKYKHYKPNR